MELLDRYQKTDECVSQNPRLESGQTVPSANEVARVYVEDLVAKEIFKNIGMRVSIKLDWVKTSLWESEKP